MDAVALASYGELSRWALARAHARSGDALTIGTYLGAADRVDRAMPAFAERYADQNERDYLVLRRAAETGRMRVQAGV